MSLNLDWSNTKIARISYLTFRFYIIHCRIYISSLLYFRLYSN
ncbi:hypothetical protein NEICINOT_03387 [Neisseria cinerea ATCC 14685]|uniref:Uncharacterized protein n=1 Tax=Neisseria cinerea ATCC 14685 TaxID=546262 RepID=D0W168_NEICI|nr:hypothetical protein NEICINOT_03387 [Neisseria cinerea ATCC 14685]